MSRKLGMPQVSPHYHGTTTNNTDCDDAVSLLFDQFCGANTFQGIMSSFQQLCDLLGLKADEHQQFYRQLKSKVTSWKAQSIWTKLDKRAQHAEYKRTTACTNTRVFIIGAGPCGLRTAIEVALLGGRAVVVEKRDRYSRNSVLHLWPFVIHDLRMLAAKKFFGKFCAGSIDHISIRSLQCIMLKVALLLGVEIHPGVTYEKIIDPPEDQSENGGWRAQVSPADHPVSEYEFDVLIGADGKRNTLSGFKRKEFRGKLAIAVTANFINRNTEAEARVEEISGVAYIFNQKFFKDLNRKTMIDLENIVYYKDETHYFVMTAKKHSLMYKGVVKQDFDDPEKLLSKENVDQEALLQYALEAADVSTNHLLPNLEFAHNHYGQPDVAMFDFTSMYASHHACRVVERHGHRLLICLVGDSLLEPFWPTGSGCARGFLGAIDAAWMIRSWASGNMTPLEVMAERESVYQLLSQTTPGSVCKNFNQWTIDPNTRYVNLNTQFVRSHQVRHLYDGGDPAYLNEIVRISEQNSRRYEWMRDSHNLLKWFMRQLEPYRSVVRVTDLTTSWRSGLALCAIIHKYRPELLDVYSLDPNRVQDNNQMAFELAEKEFGIAPLMTGEDMSLCEEPDKFTMVSYLSQFYEYFRKEGIRPAKIARPPGNVIVTKRPKRPRSKSPAHRLTHLNKASHHLRNQRLGQRIFRSWSSSEELLSIDEREEKENRRREVTKRQPAYTHGMAQKRIKDLQIQKEEPPPPPPSSKDLEYESVMMENYKRLEGIGPDAPSKLAAVRKEMQLRQHLGGMTVGLRGSNKVSQLAKGLAQKFNGETTPPTTRRRLPKPLVAEEPEEKCYFCGNKVYLLERRMAEGYSFHRGCFRCDYCSTNLRLAAYSFLKTDTGQPKFYCVQHVGMSKPFRRPRKRSFGEKDLIGPSVSPILPRQPILQGTTTILGETEPDGLVHKTPERIEYVTESEQEESEFDQTAHNLSGRLDSENDDSDESSEDENLFGDAEASDGDVSWAELAQSYSKQLQRSMNKRTGRKRMEDESGTDTATIGASDADYETESDTEKESDEDVLLIGGKNKGKGQGRNNLQLDPFGNYCPWTKPSPTSLEMMNKRMSFFSAVAEPVRIDARSFLGLTPSLDKMMEEKLPVEDEKTDSLGKDDTTPRVSEAEKETQEVKKPETGKRAAKGEEQRRKKRKVYRKKGQVQTQSLSETEEEFDQDRRQRRKRYNKYSGKVEADMAAVMQEVAAVVNIEDDLSDSDLEANLQDGSEETPTGSLENGDVGGSLEVKRKGRHRVRKDASNELEDESDTTEQDEDECNWKEVESDEILLEPIDVTAKAEITEKSEERKVIIDNLDRAVARLEDTLKELEQKKPEDYGEDDQDELVSTDEIIKTMQELEELERKRKSFFDQVTEPVRIDAHSFLGLNTEILPESETELQKLEYKDLVVEDEDAEEEEEASLQMLDDVLNGVAAQETLLTEDLTPDTEEMSDDKLAKSESDVSQGRLQNEGELQEQLEEEEEEKLIEAMNEVMDVNVKQEEFVEETESEQMKQDDTVGLQQAEDAVEEEHYVEEEQPSDNREIDNHISEATEQPDADHVEKVTEKEIEALAGKDDIVEISDEKVNIGGVIEEILESACKRIEQIESSSSSSSTSTWDDVEIKMDIDDDRISELSDTVKLTAIFEAEGIKQSQTVAVETAPVTTQGHTTPVETAQMTTQGHATESLLPEAQEMSSVSEKPVLDASVNLQDTVSVVQANLADSMETTTDTFDEIVENNMFGSPPAASLQDTLAIVEKNQHVESTVAKDVLPQDEIHVEKEDIPNTPVSEALLVTVSGVVEALPGVNDHVTPVIAKDTVPSRDEIHVEKTDIPSREEPLSSTEQSLPDVIENTPSLKATNESIDAKELKSPSTSDHALESSPAEQERQDVLEDNLGEALLTPVVIEEPGKLQPAVEEEAIKTETVPVYESPVIQKESLESETISPGNLQESPADPNVTSHVENEKASVVKDVSKKEKQLKPVNVESSEPCRIIQESVGSDTTELSQDMLDGDSGQVGVEEKYPDAMGKNIDDTARKETKDIVNIRTEKTTDTVLKEVDTASADLQETMAIVENNPPSALLEDTMTIVQQNQVDTTDLDKDISNIVKETLQRADAVDKVLPEDIDREKEKKAASKLTQIVDEGIIPLAEAQTLFGADLVASSEVITPKKDNSVSKDIFCSTPILEHGDPVRHILSEDIFASVSPPHVTEQAKPPHVTESAKPPPVTESAKPVPVTEQAKPPPVTEPAKLAPLTEPAKDMRVADEKAELNRMGSVTSVASEADAIRRIDEMLAKFDSGTESPSRENSITGSKASAKKELVAAVRLEKDLVVIATTVTSHDTRDVQTKPETTAKVAEKGERLNKIDESFVNTRDRKKRKEHSGQSDSSSFTISTPSGSVESTSSIPELGSTPAGLSASTTGESLSLGKPTTSKSGGSRSADIQISSSTEDSFALDQSAFDDSMSLDKLAAAAGLDDDTLSLDRMLDENILPADKSLDDLAEAEIDSTPTVHPSYKSPLDSSESVLPQTPADTTAGDVSQYYTPDASDVTPLSSHVSKRKSSPRQPLPQLVIESNSKKPESPRESPSVLLGAAKQKFYFAAAQPVRIDPKTLFEHIPHTNEEKQGKTPLADNTQVSGAGALDLKQGWSNLGQAASPTTPTAGVPAADTATGEVDVFYTPATSVKPKQPAKATETKSKDAKKKIILDAPEKKSSSKPLSATQDTKAKSKGAKPKFRSASDPKKREDVKVKKGKILGGSLKEKISQPPSKASTRPASAKPDLTHGRSSSSTVSSVEGPPKLATDGTTSPSEASPGARRSRGFGVKKKESRFFSPKRQKSSSKSPPVESKNPPVEKKRRSLLSKLLPSKSAEKKDKTAKSPTEPKQRSPLVLRSNEKKGKEKATGKKEKIKARSKSEDGKKSVEPELRRSMFDEVAPLMDDILSSERKKKHFADRIEEVAPPPAKAPHTTLKPPRATMDEFETESEIGDDRTSLRSFQSQTQTLSPEEMAKLLKRQQKAMKKKQHEEELRRLHTAQEIQRHLEELEIKQHEVERRGVAIEKALRGEGPDATADEALLMQEWFNAVHEKNTVVRLESELLVHARELELEDRHSRLEQQLRDRLVIDEKDMTAEDREEEQKILHELMEVVEQRNALVTLLEETRLKHEAEERGMRDIVEERGLELSPVPYTHTLRRPSQYDVLNGHR